MNLSKLIKSLISIALCLFLFSGCTQNRHLKDLLIVEGVGIDLTESKDIAVTLQSLKIGMSNSSEKPDASMTFNLSANGNTVSSAINSLAKGVSKRTFFGQNKIMVLSQKFVENGVDKYVDYFCEVKMQGRMSQFALLKKVQNSFLKVKKTIQMYQAKIYFI